ncbi:MAG: HAMP domain-containing sensor histidine kinase [Gemmatimonadaceae bacterium]|nr:HAMP domain-containing sensor histidine kinase [Gemmatimonadaceae bacterium]
MRRRATVVLAVVVGLLLGSYVWFTQRVVSRLREEAGREGRMYAQVIRALSDTSGNPTGALFNLSDNIRKSGVPVIVTDARGRATAAANLPFVKTDAQFNPDDPRIGEWIRRLDRENIPVTEPNIGTVHFGHTPLVNELRIVPLLQALMLGLVLLAAVSIFRTRAQAERERVWARMARESAQQLGTPLSSLSGWIELLRDRDADPLTTRALAQMQGDLERLERVAHRFERIGRPPKNEEVDVGVIAQRVADYFRSRVPSLAHAVTIETYIHQGPMIAHGDPVLVEWVLEALIKNSIDSLAGNGGRVRVGVKRLPEAIQLMVADDGPGVPRELRKRIFEPGFSTKQHGWGLGLALTRRIVEESHGGKLTLLSTERGAVFQIIFPA